MKNLAKPVLLFLSLSGVLILIWFKQGLLYGGGDVGLQTYNPQRILENARFVWWDAAGPGTPLPQGLSAIPFQFSLYLLQLLGFSPVAMQASLFFFLLFLMGFGMYLFLRTKMEEKSAVYPVLGGLFYMFNPYVMIQVWHRFIHTTIILAAVLPFFAIFWDRWIRHGKVINLSIFLLINFLAVYIFGTYAYIITVWVFLFLLTLPVLIPWQGKKVFFQIGLRFLFGLILWVLINCWWAFPIVKISPALLSQQHHASESIGTLVSISAQAILPFSLQLINPYYLFYQAEFGNIYRNIFFQVIPLFFLLIILLGLLNSLKNKKFSSYGILYLISLFLAKGAAPPFGYLYILGFTNIFALGILRNPFEKTGIIATFFATTLFVLGARYISGKLKWVVIFIIILLFIFAWPMLFGKLFGSINKPALVKVPSSYKLADQYLQQQKNTGILDGKILHLPLTRLESVNYKWEYGYNGLEPSDTFFTAYPSISRGFNVQRVDDALTALSLIFNKDFVKDSDKILQLLQVFNVRFIVLHKDLIWSGADVSAPSDVEKVLNDLNFIEKKKEFGDLIIYQIKDEFFGSKIEISNSVSYVYPQKINMGMWPWLASKGKGFFVSPVLDNGIDETITPSVKETLIFPENNFAYTEASESGYSFFINTKDNYELLGSFKLDNTFVSKPQILKGKVDNNFITFGSVKLNQGLKEISLTQANLVSSSGSFMKIGDVKIISDYFQITPTQLNPVLVESSVGKVFGNDIFVVSFEAQIPEDVVVFLRVTQSSDAEEQGGEIPRISFQVLYNQSTGWQSYKFKLPPLSFMIGEAKIQFVATSQGSQILGSNAALLRNIKVVRVLNSDIFLRSNSLYYINKDIPPGEVINFVKINPTRYEGMLNLRSPGFVFFKETYHPGWKLQLIKDNQAIEPKNHYIGFLYGNAWYIDKAGEYKFRIVFEPQANFTLGVLFSGLGVLILGAYAMFKRFKK